jgi:hypothetical protein
MKLLFALHDISDIQQLKSPDSLEHQAPAMRPAGCQARCRWLLWWHRPVNSAIQAGRDENKIFHSCSGGALLLPAVDSTGVLSVDGKEVARKTTENSMPITLPEDETFDVGSDTRTGVAMIEYRYEPPFKFPGKIDKLTFKLEPEPQAATKH